MTRSLNDDQRNTISDPMKMLENVTPNPLVISIRLLDKLLQNCSIIIEHIIQTVYQNYCSQTRGSLASSEETRGTT